MFKTLVSLCRKWYKLVGKTCIPVCTMITKPGLQPVKIPNAPHSYWGKKSYWKNVRKGLLHTRKIRGNSRQKKICEKQNLFLPEISVMIRFNLDFLSFSPDPVPVPLPICLRAVLSEHTNKVWFSVMYKKKVLIITIMKICVFVCRRQSQLVYL